MESDPLRLFHDPESEDSSKEEEDPLFLFHDREKEQTSQISSLLNDMGHLLNTMIDAEEER